MASCVASCCASLACSAASSGAQGVCAGCNAAGKAGEQAARIMYVILMFFAAILATVMSSVSQDYQTHVPGDPFEQRCTHELCRKNQGVYRVSVAVTIFFLFLSVFTPCCQMLHTQLWTLKIPLYLGVVAGCFFISNNGLAWFVSFSRVVSVIFLLISVVILVEFSYDVHEELVERADEADEQTAKDRGVTVADVAGFCSTRWRILYVLLCICLFGFAIAAWVTAFVKFKCSFATAMTAIALALGVILMVASSATSAGLLPGTVVNAYLAYLNASALTKNDNECNPFRGELTGGWVWVGVVISALTIGYLGYSVSSNFRDAFGCGWCEDKENKEAMSELEEQQMHDVVSGDLEGAKQRDSGDPDNETPVGWTQISSPKWTYGFFHLVMAFCGSYMAMILTNWSNNIDHNPSTCTVNGLNSDICKRAVQDDLANDSSMWAILASAWVCAVFFGISILAPILFPDRDFSDAKNKRKPHAGRSGAKKHTPDSGPDLSAQQDAVANFSNPAI